MFVRYQYQYKHLIVLFEIKKNQLLYVWNDVLAVNLAFMRPAIQSTSTVYDPGNAVDANTLGTFGFIGTTGSGTCCHTQVMQSGWTPVYWEVDLGAISIITRISITYRDTCKFLILI